jgi:hypothetical protein
MSEITGVTFPMPKHLTPRFFKDKKTVFIKPATVFKELRPGMRLVFTSHTKTPATPGRRRSGGSSSATTPSRSSRPSGMRSSSREEAEAYVENQERWQGVRVRK